MIRMLAPLPLLTALIGCGSTSFTGTVIDVNGASYLRS